MLRRAGVGSAHAAATLSVLGPFARDEPDHVAAIAIRQLTPGALGGTLALDRRLPPSTIVSVAAPDGFGLGRRPAPGVSEWLARTRIPFGRDGHRALDDAKIPDFRAVRRARDPAGRQPSTAARPATSTPMSATNFSLQAVDPQAATTPRTYRGGRWAIPAHEQRDQSGQASGVDGTEVAVADGGRCRRDRVLLRPCLSVMLGLATISEAAAATSSVLGGD